MNNLHHSVPYCVNSRPLATDADVVDGCGHGQRQMLAALLPILAIPAQPSRLERPPTMRARAIHADRCILVCETTYLVATKLLLRELNST